MALIMSSLTLSAARLLYFPRKRCLREINIACWHESKEISIKKEATYWNLLPVCKQFSVRKHIVKINTQLQVIKKSFFNEILVPLLGSLLLMPSLMSHYPIIFPLFFFFFFWTG